MRIKISVLLFALVIFLTACAQEEADTIAATGTMTIVSIPKWETFIGEPVLNDLNYESLQEIAVIDEGILLLDDVRFTNIALPAGKTNISLSYGWQIDLSKLVPIGKTHSGEVVLSLETTNPPVVCLINTKSEELHLYLNEALHNNIGEHLNCDTFVPMVEGNIDLDTEEITHLLQIHLGNDPHPDDKFYLDGTREFYEIRLVHKECEVLQYVLKIGQWEEYIALLTVQNDWRFCEHVH